MGNIIGELIAVIVFMGRRQYICSCEYLAESNDLENSSAQTKKLIEKTNPITEILLFDMVILASLCRVGSYAVLHSYT